MAILITGGTGFLGRHLTQHLLQSGEKGARGQTFISKQFLQAALRPS